MRVMGKSDLGPRQWELPSATRCDCPGNRNHQKKRENKLAIRRSELKNWIGEYEVGSDCARSSEKYERHRGARGEDEGICGYAGTQNRTSGGIYG